jgi:hypothetical protein
MHLARPQLSPASRSTTLFGWAERARVFFRSTYTRECVSLPRHHVWYKVHVPHRATTTTRPPAFGRHEPRSTALGICSLVRFQAWCQQSEQLQKHPHGKSEPVTAANGSVPPEEGASADKPPTTPVTPNPRKPRRAGLAGHLIHMRVRQTSRVVDICACICSLAAITSRWRKAVREPIQRNCPGQVGSRAVWLVGFGRAAAQRGNKVRSPH